MANETVSFEITANTKEAGKAILELQRKLNSLQGIKSNDKETQAELKVFEQINETLGEILTKEKQRGRHYTTYAANAKKVETLNAALKENEATLAKFSERKAELEQKQKDGSITPDEVNELSRAIATVENLEQKRKQLNSDINKYTKRNNELNNHAEKELAGLVGQYGEIRTDESSILGLKVQSKQETQGAVAAEGELADKTKQTNAGLAETADNAKKAKDAIRDATKTPNKGQEASIDMGVDKTKQDLLDLRATVIAIKTDVSTLGDKMRTDPATDNVAELIRRYNQLGEAKREIEKLGMPKDADSTYATILRLMEQLNGQINTYKHNLRDASTAHNEVANSGKRLKFLPTLFNTIKTGLTALRKHSDKVKRSFDSMAKSMRSNFKHMITSITKYVLGFRSLFFLVRRLRKYIGEGIKNMAQFNDGNNHVNASINRLLSSLLYLKNAWATAFSPILQFITPWLEALIDKIAEVGNAFSRFLGNLLGQSKVFQAVKVKAADYGKSLEKTGGSAGKAADKTKKLTDRLAAFDDLNVLGVDKDPDKNGSGGGGGYGDEYQPDPNKMFKIVEVANDIKKKLQEMWQFGDFSKLGEELAQKLKEQLENLLTKFPEIKETANRIGRSIGTFLTGFLSDPSVFKDMGSVVAEWLNTFGEAISGFFDGYKEGSIGTALADFFRGAFTSFDWKLAGDNISRFVTGFFTEITTFLQRFPHDELVQGIEDFFESIDWAAVVSAIFSFIGTSAGTIGAILTGISNVLSNITSDDIIAAFEQIDWQAVADGFGELLGGAIALAFTSVKLAFTICKAIVTGIANAWVGAMEEAGLLDKFMEGVKELSNKETFWQGVRDIGSALVGGIAKGIEDAFVNAVDWVEEHLAGPIVDGFCSLFEIGSPSGVAEEWGNWIVQGLANGLITLVSTVLKPFTDLKNKLNEMLINIRGDIFTAIVLLRIGLVEAFNSIKTALKAPINGILSIIESMVNKIINGINSLFGKLRDLPDFKITNPFNGKEYNLSIKMPTLRTVSIPRLAQGAVIPPNKEFMAMLGDQSHGTNIEAPLDTIKQAVAEVLANNGNAEVIQLLQQLITVVENKELAIGDKQIAQANARYSKQQQVIRGATY